MDLLIFEVGGEEPFRVSYEGNDNDLCKDLNNTDEKCLLCYIFDTKDTMFFYKDKIIAVQIYNKNKKL